MTRIRQLYAVERKAKLLSPDERQAMRQTESVRLLDLLGQWLEETQHRVLPKSPIGTAISYALANWIALCR